MLLLWVKHEYKAYESYLAVQLLIIFIEAYRSLSVVEWNCWMPANQEAILLPSRDHIKWTSGGSKSAAKCLYNFALVIRFTYFAMGSRQLTAGLTSKQLEIFTNLVMLVDVLYICSNVLIAITIRYEKI